MVIIGLTGSIGSGKSTVRALLEGKGAAVIDADVVGHEVYMQGSEVWNKIIAAWGREILSTDGEIDRKKLGEVVFESPEELKRLNEIVHPVMKETVQSQLMELKKENTPAVVLEAALLIEAGWNDLVDEVWLVTADRNIATKRLIHNRGLTEQQASMRLERQMPIEEKAKYSDIIIENNRDTITLRNIVDNVWAEKFGSTSNPESRVI